MHPKYGPVLFPYGILSSCFGASQLNLGVVPSVCRDWPTVGKSRKSMKSSGILSGLRFAPIMIVPVGDWFVLVGFAIILEMLRRPRL